MLVLRTGRNKVRKTGRRVDLAATRDRKESFRLDMIFCSHAWKRFFRGRSFWYEVALVLVLSFRYAQYNGEGLICKEEGDKRLSTEATERPDVRRAPG